MEAEQYIKGLVPYPILANTEKIFKTLEVIKDVTKGKLYCHFLKTCSSPSFKSHVTNRERSVELAPIIGQLYSDEEPEENQTDGETLFSPDYKEVGDPAQPPKSDSYNKRHRVYTKTTPRHMLSANTCSDLKWSIDRRHSTFWIDEVTNIEASSSEDQEDEEDEYIFTELPRYKTALESWHKKYISQGKQDRCQHISNKDVFPVSSGRDWYKKKLKEHRLHLETQLAKESQWYDSMLFLMNKLEQLNLDIEEALHVDFSPSGTPCTKRRKQMIQGLSETCQPEDTFAPQGSS